MVRLLKISISSVELFLWAKITQSMVWCILYLQQYKKVDFNDIYLYQVTRLITKVQDTIQCLFLCVGLFLKVIKQNWQGSCLFPEVFDDCTRCPYGLLHTPIIVELRQSTPSTKVLTTVYHDYRHLSLLTKSADKLFVLLVLAILGQAAETSLAAIEGLGTLVKAFL